MYQIWIYNTLGNAVVLLDRYESLSIEHRVNGFSTHQLVMDGYDPRVANFTLDSLIEVRRSRLDGTWYTEYIGFHRTPQRTLSETDSYQFTSFGRGLLDLLNRRSILYYAESAGSEKSGVAETVMKNFVRENAGVNSTLANLRVRNGVLEGLTIQADGALGPTWEGARAWQPLLKVLQEMAPLVNIDFDIIWTGGVTFEFRTYLGQRGTDRTVGNGVVAPVIFAPEFGNMVRPHYTNSRTEEATVVAVLGQGEADDRDVVIRSSAAISDSPWNDIEATRDARQSDEIAQLEDIGDEELEQLQAQESFTFEALQTNDVRYGEQYVLGDLVTARFGDITRNIKIVGIRILSNEERDEAITVEFSTTP